MVDPDETRGSVDHGVDSFISDLGGFFLAWARTWGLHLFRPHRAAELLLADGKAGHPRYVSAPTFLIVSGMLVSFLMGEDPFQEGYVAGLATSALKLVQLEADILLIVVGGLVQAAVFYAAARILGLFSPPARRDDMTSVAMYLFPSAMLGMLPAVFANVVLGKVEWLPGELILVVVAIYGVLVAPALTLGFFGWRNPGRFGRWTGLATPVPLVLAVFSITVVGQFALEESFNRADLGAVWLAPVKRPSVNGITHSITLRAWHDRPDPVELCPVAYFCATDPPLVDAAGAAERGAQELAALVAEEEARARGDESAGDGATRPIEENNPETNQDLKETCVPARFQSRSWVPPELEVELDFVLLDRGTVPAPAAGLDLRYGQVCCPGVTDDKPPLCFEGYKWPDPFPRPKD